MGKMGGEEHQGRHSCPVLFVLKIEERWQHGNGVAETAEGLRSRAREWLSMLVGGRSSK